MALSNLFGWNKKQNEAPLPLVVLPAALLISRKRNLPLAVLPVVLATSPLRLPPLVALLTSRKKNPAPVVLPVVLAISKSFHSH
jgi:hypothetical protein